MSVTTSEQLKALQVRATKAGEELAQIRAEQQEINRRYSEASGRLNAINADIAKLKEVTTEPIVSEHAMLRYIERVLLVDLAAVRAALLTPRNVAAINFVRNGKVPAGDGVTLVIKDRTVVSVLTKNEEVPA